MNDVPGELLVRIKAILANMDGAADDVGLRGADPLRFMMRLFGLSVLATAEIVAHLAQASIDACSTLAEQKAREDRLRRAVAAERTRSTRLFRAVVTGWVATFVLTAIVATAVATHTVGQPIVTVDFGRDDNGVVRCPSRAEDERGDLHCSMTIILTSNHQRR